MSECHADTFTSQHHISSVEGGQTAQWDTNLPGCWACKVESCYQLVSWEDLLGAARLKCLYYRWDDILFSALVVVKKVKWHDSNLILRIMNCGLPDLHNHFPQNISQYVHCYLTSSPYYHFGRQTCPILWICFLRGQEVYYVISQGRLRQHILCRMLKQTLCRACQQRVAWAICVRRVLWANDPCITWAELQAGN